MQAQERGILTVERIDDVVVVVQDGWFDGPLMDRMFADVGVALDEALAKHRVGFMVADTRTYDGCSSYEQIRCERWLEEIGALAKLTVVIAAGAPITGQLELAATFMPTLRWRFADSVVHACKVIGREQQVARVARVLASAKRLRPLSTAG